jgi:hypothetical protein
MRRVAARLVSCVTLCAAAALAARVVLAAPAPADAPAPLPAPQEVAREVDELLASAWKEGGVEPTEPADDAAFLRRLSLDVEGVVPEERTVAAVLAQAGKRDPARRAAWVHGLVRGQGFARSMATRWANLLVGRQAVLEAEGRDGSLAGWLAIELGGDARWDAVIGDLLAPAPAAAGMQPSGPATYRARYGGRIEEVVGNTLRVFQGLPLQCAQCHDHPYHEEWKQTDFWGVVAFLGPGPRLEVPGKGVAAPRRYLDGRGPPDGLDGPHALAALLTDAKNPYFARATVNRVWSFFLGRGFVDPDDVTQTSALPAVLERLERDFQASGHDLRRLCEVVLDTRAYGLSSAGPAGPRDAQLALFARAPLRPLSPEQLWASLARATGLEEAPASLKADQAEQARARLDQLRREFYRTFAAQLRDGDPETYSVAQALSLLNGPLTNALLRPADTPLMSRLLALGSLDEQLTSLYLRAVGRPPSRGERAALRGAAGRSSDERTQLLQDLLWALVNSSEFGTNH